MLYKNITDWKIDQISNLTTLINNEATSGGTMYQWDNFESEAINPVTSYINSLSYVNIVTSDIIKEQLISLLSYVSIKYNSIFTDPVLESSFTIPYIIAPGTTYTNENDFRNLNATQELPELSLADFIFTATPISADPIVYSYSVSAASSFIQLQNNTSSIWPTANYNKWKNISINTPKIIQDKILYLAFNIPEMKIIDPPTNSRNIILNDMKLYDAIVELGLENDFNKIFVEFQ